MDLFMPPVNPGYDDASLKESPRTISVSFGDGYKQEIPDGLNANDATASYTWPLLNTAQATDIMSFYKSHIGKTFMWAAPGDLIGNGKWRIVDATCTPVGYDEYSIQMDLERSFELS